MSNIDRKYIDALNTFTSALEQIVETLKEQQSTGKSDVVNEFLKSMPENLVSVVEELKKTTEKGFADIKNDNQKILAKIESIKKSNEAGSFERIEDPKNKNKIVDGIKMVMLIAGGVLALGLAFKLIGAASIGKAIILSAVMLMIAQTYGKISSVSGLNVLQIAKIAAMLPLMATGLAISGFILRNFPKFTLAQGLSILFIGGALGAVSILMLESLSKMKLKSLLLVPLLPFILPFIALGIVKASIILGGIIPLSFRQVIAVALVGAAIGIAMFAVGTALRFMKNVTWKELVMLPLVMPLIAWSIVKASEIFQNMRSLRDPFGILKTTAVVGLSLLIFSPALYILGKMKFKDALSGSVIVPILAFSIVMASKIFVDFVPLIVPPFTFLLSSLAIGLSLLIFAPTVFIIGKMKMGDILAGAAAIPIMALAIVIAAGIFAGLPNRMKYPDFIWSLGVGLSMLIFAPVVYATNRIGLKKMAEAMIIVPLLASLIVATAIIFKLLPNRMEYPDIQWTLGAGLSILAFGTMSVALGAIMASTAGIGFAAIALGMAAIALIAVTIVATAAILSKGNYGIYPSLKWTLGVGGSLLAFSLISVAAAAAGVVGLIGSFFTGGKNPMVKLAESMIQVAEKLNEFDWSTAKHPSKEYTESVGDFLLTFAKIYTLVSATEGFNKIVSAIFGGGKTDSFTVFIVKASDSMIYLNKRLNEVNWNTKNYPSKDYTEGVGGFLESMANVFWRISKVEGFNRIITRLFGGGADTFTVFIVKAADSMIYMHGQLSRVNWGTENYPKKEYADGVGGLLESLAFVFSKISKVEGFSRIITALFGGGADNFNVFVEKAAFSMKYLNEQLGSVNWSGNYPKKEFAEGVGGLLESLANSFAAISKVDRKNGFLSIFTKQKTSFDDFVRSAADSMITLNTKIGGINWNTAKYPKKEYSEGIGLFLVMMADAYSKLNKRHLKMDGNMSLFAEEASKSIVKASNILSGANFDVNIKKEWIEGFSLFMISTSDMLDRINFKRRDKKDLESIGLILLQMTEYSNKISQINFELDIKRDWIDNFSYFIISLSDIIEKSEFKKDKISKFADSSALLPAINSWSKSMSGISDISVDRKTIENFSNFIIRISDIIKQIDFDSLGLDKFISSLNKISNNGYLSKIITQGNYNNYPSNEYINSFYYYLAKINELTSDWSTTVEESEKFNVSIKLIFESFSKLPNLNDGIINNMIIIKASLKELSEGMDIFMIEKRGGIFGGKKERSMEDFKLFAEGLSIIVSSISLLSTIKPLPGGVTQVFLEFVKQLKSLPEISGLDEKTQVIYKLSTSFAALSDSIAKVNSNLQNFVNLYKGIPSINTLESNSTLQTVEGASKLKVVNASIGQNILDKTKEKPIEVKVTSEEPKLAEKPDDKQQKFYTDISDIKNLLYEIKEDLISPPKAGSFN
jgi:hypothetical protein